MTREMVRLIAGKYRSRLIKFPAITGLRPTPDRVRETVFNWLRLTIPGARVLDLFAGSGALGLEALSRGAADVVLVDQHPEVVAALSCSIETLSAHHATVICADARAYLKNAANGLFDIVFVDPPFAQKLLPDIFPLLAKRVRAGSQIYVERHHSHPLPPLPDGWALEKEKRAGVVSYCLLSVAAI